VQFALEMCVPAQNHQKSIRNPILGFKVIAFGANQKPVYNFLLVIDSNLGPILHHFQDPETCLITITNFPYPFSFSTLALGEPCGIYGKALRILKLVKI